MSTTFEMSSYASIAMLEIYSPQCAICVVVCFRNAGIFVVFETFVARCWRKCRLRMTLKSGVLKLFQMGDPPIATINRNLATQSASIGWRLLHWLVITIVVTLYFEQFSARNCNHNRKFQISTAPIKVKSREPAYSQTLNQNQFDRGRPRELCTRDSRRWGFGEITGWIIFHIRYLSQCWHEFVPMRRGSYG